MDEDYLRDLFEPVGPITVKRMFGGQGIYGPNGIFAIVAFDKLYVKGDDQSSPAYEAEGMARWVYENPKTGRESAMPYWQVPDDALEDAEAMAPWAKLATETATRAKE